MRNATRNGVTTSDGLDDAIRNVVLTAVAMIGFIVLVAALTSALPEQPEARTIGEWWETRPPILISSALVLVLGLVTTAIYWSRHGRDASAHRVRQALGAFVISPMRETLVPEYEPPADMSPAEFGALVDGVADTHHVTATLIDLAIRGHVAIRETAGRGWVLSKLKSRDSLARTFEETLLSTLFENADEIALDKINDTFYWATVSTELDLDDELVRRGWFVSDPAMLRRGRRLRGLALTAAGLLVTAGLGIRLGAGYLGLALVITGLAFTIAAGSMHARTALGHRLLLKSLGFKMYLEIAEARVQRFAEHTDLFTKYLPYAVALGIAKEWATRFDLAGTVYAHAWYKPAESGELRHVDLAERLSRMSSSRS